MTPVLTIDVGKCDKNWNHIGIGEKWMILLKIWMRT